MQKITIETIFQNSGSITEDIARNVSAGRRLAILAVMILICGGVYGFTMGIAHSWLQALSSAIKVPALFVLTLAVCLPTLHFVGLFLGSRHSFSQSATILLLGIAVSSVLLLGFSMIAGFFWITGSQYRFLLLMHVFFFGVAGAAGLITISRAYAGLKALQEGDTGRHQAEASRPAGNGQRAGRLRGRPSLLHVWMLLYMFVGTQMAYTLGPFVGREPEFHLFHRQPGNFYSYVAATLGRKLDHRLAPERARELLEHPAVAILHMLADRDYARLANVVDPRGVRLVRAGLPYDDFDGNQDPLLDRPDLLEAAEAQARGRAFRLQLRWPDSDASRSAPVESIDIDEYIERFVLDMNFFAAVDAARYNEFSRGLDRKEKLYAYFFDGEFVEFVIPGEAGRFDVLRLVFTNDVTGPKLRAVIRDRSI